MAEHWINKFVVIYNVDPQMLLQRENTAAHLGRELAPWWLLQAWSEVVAIKASF
jgi:hypothetical protein